jgi:hypothetical protein
LRHLRHPGLDMDMRIETIIGVLLIIGLSLGIGFGFYQEYDGKNLRDLAGVNSELRARAISAEHAVAEALQQAREDRERLAHYIEYVLGKLEEP